MGLLDMSDDMNGYVNYQGLVLNPSSLFVDAGSTPYSCPHCDKWFVRSDVRARHVATMHGDEQEIKSSGSDTPSALACFHQSGYTLMLSRKMRRRSEHSRPEQTTPLRQSRPASIPDTVDPNQIPLGMLWSHERNLPGLSQSTPAPSLYVPPTPTSASSLLSNQSGLMLPPATSTFNLVSPPSGFLDPSSLATGPSSYSMQRGRSICTTSASMADYTGSNLGTDTPSDLLNPFSTNWELFGQVFGWGLDTDIDLDTGLQNGMFENSTVGLTCIVNRKPQCCLVTGFNSSSSESDGRWRARTDP